MLAVGAPQKPPGSTGTGSECTRVVPRRIERHSARGPGVPRTVSGDAELPARPVTGRRELVGRQKPRQIRRLQERPDLDLAPAGHGIGAALRPGHGLVHVLDLPDREARDQLLGLGERPVDDGAAATVEGDALGLGARLEAGGGHHHAGLDQLLREPVHRLERLRGGRNALFGLLTGFHEHHDAHRLSPCSSRPFCLLIGTTIEPAENRHRPANFFSPYFARSHTSRRWRRTRWTTIPRTINAAPMATDRTGKANARATQPSTPRAASGRGQRRCARGRVYAAAFATA